jgi:hypothetical protein
MRTLQSGSRRFAAVVAALATCAAVWPAAALARDRAYNGPAGSGPNAGVEFGAHVRKGRARKVFRFEFHNVPATCQGGATSAVTAELPDPMKVSSKEFHAHAVVNRLTVDVSGVFTKHFSKSHGTIRVRGTAAGCPGADTGVVQWKAPRLGT